MDVISFEKEFINLPSPVQSLEHPLFEKYGVEVLIKRDDLLHPIVSGNKWRKLKEYLLIAQKQGNKGIISFGGAYSNHLYALSYVCNSLNLSFDAIIRGNELNSTSNVYLEQMNSWGANLHFVNREDYREKIAPIGVITTNKLIIPEGGFSEIGVDSMIGLANELENITFDHLFTAVGTGTTIIGLGRFLNQKTIHGILSLKNKSEIQDHLNQTLRNSSNVIIWDQFIQKKYGKKNTELEEFCIDFKSHFGFEIEPIYTGLMIQSVFQLIEDKYFETGTKILLLHSGGIK